MKLCRTCIYLREIPSIKISPGKTATTWSRSHLSEEQSLHWYLQHDTSKISLLQRGESIFFNVCFWAGNTPVTLNPKCELDLWGCPGTPGCTLSWSHHWHQVHLLAPPVFNCVHSFFPTLGTQLTLHQPHVWVPTGSVWRKKSHNWRDCGTVKPLSVWHLLGLHAQRRCYRRIVSLMQQMP